MTTSQLEAPTAAELAEPRPEPGAIWTNSRRRALFTVALAGCGIGLFFVYLGQARTMPVAADGSAQALQAWDMLHGNLLLRGWSLTDVTFYPTELVQYMLIEAVRGLTTDVVHIAAAMTYTLLVLGVGLVAKGDVTGREGLIRMVVASSILLALPLGMLSTTWLVLNFPNHTGTQVPLLLIWLLLDRVRPRWWLPVLIAALLTWVQVADTMALYEGVLPLVVVCGFRVLQRRGRLTTCRYELSLAAGALLSVYLATQTLLLIRRVGGFEFTPPNNGLSSMAGLSQHIWEKLGNLLTLFGIDYSGLPPRLSALPVLHIIGLAAVLWSVAVAMRRFTRPDSLMIQVLTVAFFAVLGAFTFGSFVGGWEAVGLLTIGAVLAGRLLPERMSRAGLVVSLAAVLTCFGLSFSGASVAPGPKSQEVRMANWLEAHHLRYGLAIYWQANPITLISGDRVQTRPIGVKPDGFFLTHWNTKATWYSPRLHDATFIIWKRYELPSPWSIEAAFGLPARTYRVGSDLVMVWHKNLLNGQFAGPRRVPWDILALGTMAGPDTGV